MSDKISPEEILDEVCRLDFEEYAAAPFLIQKQNTPFSRKADRRLRSANNNAHKLNRRLMAAVISLSFIAVIAVSGAAAVNNGLFSFNTALRLETVSVFLSVGQQHGIRAV